MRRWLTAAAFLLVATTCNRDRDPPEARKPPPVQEKEPRRVAAQDQSLRVMLAEIAAARACEMMRGQLRPMRDGKRPDVVTGTLWVRGCKITQRGTDVTFRLSGNGWQWAAEQTKKAGGTFALHQYVKFGVDVTIPGKLDVAYDTDTHVLALLYTPTAEPEVTFTPVGDIEIDEKGTWSNILGGVSTVFGSPPEEEGAAQARTKGAEQFTEAFAKGLALTIDLCTGLTRFGLGRPAAGKMQTPDPGESRAVKLEIQPGGTLLLGTYIADKGMTANVRVHEGAARVSLVCASAAEMIAEAYLDGRAASPKPLVTKDVRREATLRVRSARCPVALLIRPLLGSGPVTLDWRRPDTEAAASRGGPMIHCER